LIYELIANIIITRVGFGLYLQSVDPEGRHWEWQVKNICVYCRIHLRRSIENVEGVGFRTERGKRMMDILLAQTQESYDAILEEVSGM